MANSKNYLAIYAKTAEGNLQRHAVCGMSKATHANFYQIGPTTNVETLVGWPEKSVEWHGNIGYAAHS